MTKNEPDKSQLLRKASDLRDLARKVEIAAGVPRASEAARKSAIRKAERDLFINPPKEVQRRADCLRDPYLFMPTYFPDVFFQPFTDDRREMIDAIVHASRYGGDQAVAGPRADGKTRSALFAALLLGLGGFVPFTLIISKSGPVASRELSNLKYAIPASKTFRADFPEIAETIVALGRWASRARQQTVFGEYTDLEWGEERIVLPRIRNELLWENGWPLEVKSAASEQILASLGIEGAIRGYNVRNRRPTLVILDDIDDRESAQSETQTGTRKKIIEEDVGGLAGPDKTIARVMLCTLINRTCNAATFTDRTKKPSWRGQRHKLLLTKPDREDLWEEYMQLRQNRAADDPDARVAHEFYLANRDVMDAGAVVTNPYRFDSRLFQDGQPSEVSALQACYNLIADRGWEHFATEYQNDPPEESGPIESGLTANRIQRQLSGVPRRIVPSDCKAIVQGIDCGKVLLHWAVRAFRADATGYTIDRDVTPVHGTTVGTDEGLDIALIRALKQRFAEIEEDPYMRADGEIVPVMLTLIDAHYRTDAIYQACKELGRGVMPAMGFGKSAGCIRANFNPDQKPREGVYVGDGWTLVEIDPQKWNGLWRVNMDTDRWKAWEHDRWMTDPTKPGCIFLFGEPSERGDRLSDDEKSHMSYAKQIVAEVEVEEVHKGALRRRWSVKSDKNHWLDASYMCDVAASIKGIRLLKQQPKPAKKPPPQESVPMDGEYGDSDQPFLASLRN